MLRIIALTLGPFQAVARAIELYKLRRRMRSDYRRFISTGSGVRIECDTEYLVRLREMHAERRKTRAQMHVSGPSPGHRPHTCFNRLTREHLRSRRRTRRASRLAPC